MIDQSQNVRIAGIGWKVVWRALLGVAGLLLVLSTLRELTSLLQMLLVAAFLAIAADAAARSVQRFGVSRAWSLVIVIGGGIAAGILTLLMLVRPIIQQAGELIDAAPDIAHSLESDDTYQKVAKELHLSDSFVDNIRSTLVEIPYVIFNLVGDVVGSIFGLVTLIIAVSFMLAGGRQAIGLLCRIVPPLATANGWQVITGAYTNIGRYVVGATTQAILAGVSLTLVLLVFGVPYALSLGVFMFIMDYIPLVGATVGSVPAVAVALFTGGWTDGVAVLLFLVIYQQIENTVIQPRIQGRIVQLPGIAIFFSVLVGSELLGVLGALIAVPMASVAQIILTQYFDFVGRPPVELPRMFDERGRPLVGTPHEVATTGNPDVEG